MGEPTTPRDYAWLIERTLRGELPSVPRTLCANCGTPIAPHNDSPHPVDPDPYRSSWWHSEFGVNTTMHCDPNGFRRCQELTVGMPYQQATEYYRAEPVAQPMWHQRGLWADWFRVRRERDSRVASLEAQLERELRDAYWAEFRGAFPYDPRVGDRTTTEGRRGLADTLAWRQQWEAERRPVLLATFATRLGAPAQTPANDR